MWTMHIMQHLEGNTLKWSPRNAWNLKRGCAAFYVCAPYQTMTFIHYLDPATCRHVKCKHRIGLQDQHTRHTTWASQKELTATPSKPARYITSHPSMIKPACHMLCLHMRRWTQHVRPHLFVLSFLTPVSLNKCINICSNRSMGTSKPLGHLVRHVSC